MNFPPPKAEPEWKGLPSPPQPGNANCRALAILLGSLRPGAWGLGAFTPMVAAPRGQGLVKGGPCSSQQGEERTGCPHTLSHCPQQRSLQTQPHRSLVSNRPRAAFNSVPAPPLTPLHPETANDKRLSSPTQSTMSVDPCYTLYAEGLTRPSQVSAPAELPVSREGVDKGQ